MSEMNRRWLPALIAALLCLGLWVFWIGEPTAVAQTDPTPTADAEGVISVIVQPNDSLWAIAARAGISLAELLELNGLTETSVVQPGDRLIIGYGTPPATPTSDLPTATLLPPPPQATAVPARTAICVNAFVDADRDGVRDENEALRSGVAFTIYNANVVVANIISDGSGMQCAENLAGGTYHITRSVARDEVLTTDGNWTVTLVAGAVLEQAFGSYTGPPPTAAAGPTIVATVTPLPLPTRAPLITLPQLDTTPNARVSATLVLLCLCLVVLLLSVAVLIFWVGYGRTRAKTTQTQSSQTPTEE